MTSEEPGWNEILRDIGIRVLLTAYTMDRLGHDTIAAHLRYQHLVSTSTVSEKVALGVVRDYVVLTLGHDPQGKIAVPDARARLSQSGAELRGVLGLTLGNPG